MFCGRFLYAFLGLSIAVARADITPRSFSVEVTATAQRSGAGFNLNWLLDPDATGYLISRKSASASAWGPSFSLPGDAAAFASGHLSSGDSYEYQIIKTTRQGFKAYGYIYAGNYV